MDKPTHMKHPDGRERTVNGKLLKADLEREGFQEAPLPPKPARSRAKRDTRYWSDYAFRDY